MVSHHNSERDFDDRKLAGWEIASIFSSALIGEWAISSLAGRGTWLGAIPITLALFLIWFSYKQRGETLHEIGFRADNFVAACRILLLPTLLAVVLIVLGSWLAAHGNFSLRPLRLRLLAVPIWALFQQAVLQGFINRRAQVFLGSGTKSILLVALIFGVLHLPGPLLTVLAFIGGVVWATVYQRKPNLWALAISHTIVSLTLSLAIPAALSYNLRIGFKFFGFIF